MDLVHDRGSMDPVQRGGPWTPGPCFVLTPKSIRANVFYLGERGEIKTFKFPSILFNILASLQTTLLV